MRHASVPIVIAIAALASAEAADVGTVRKEIVRAATRHGLHPKLVESVANRESGYNAAAVSPKGAIGVMQLVGPTARSLGVRNPWDVRQNVEGGTRLLRMLIDRYKGDLRCALAAYNAGEPAVERLGCAPFAETRTYVQNVLGDYFGITVKQPDTKQRGSKKKEKKRQESIVAVDESGRLVLRVRPGNTGGKLLR